jgi:hypothetical protein
MQKYFTLLLILISISGYTQLSGAYTIDYNLPSKKKNYNSITEATNDIKNKNISSDVVFVVKNEYIYDLIVFEEIGNENFKIAFTSDNNLKIISDIESLYVINSLNISFENIEFISNNKDAIKIEDSENILFKNCNIRNKENLEKIYIKNSYNITFN